MERGVLEFGKSLLDPVPEERRASVSAVEHKLETEFGYPALSIAEKVEILEKIMCELQKLQVVKNFAELQTDTRHKERVMALLDKSQDPSVVTHYLRGCNMHILSGKSTVLYRFGFDLEHIYVFTEQNCYILPSGVAEAVLDPILSEEDEEKQKEELAEFLDRVEKVAKQDYIPPFIHPADFFKSYMQSRVVTYAARFLKFQSKAPSQSAQTADSPCAKVKQDFLAIIDALASHPLLLSAVNSKLYACGV